MDRKELYAEIKKYNLQETIKDTYGDSYTRISNAELEDVVTSYKKMLKEDPKSQKKASNAVLPDIKKLNIPEHWFDCLPFGTLIEILYKKRILLDSEVKELIDNDNY